MGRKKKRKAEKSKAKKKIYQKAVSFHCLQAELCVLSGLWLASCLVSETIDPPVTRSLSVQNKGRCWPLGGSLVTGLKSDNLLLQEELTFFFHAYPTTGAPLRSLWRWQLSLPSTPKQLPCGIKQDTTGAHFSLLELKRYYGSTFFFLKYLLWCVGFERKENKHRDFEGTGQPLVPNQRDKTVDEVRCDYVVAIKFPGFETKSCTLGLILSTKPKQRERKTFFPRRFVFFAQ